MSGGGGHTRTRMDAQSGGGTSQATSGARLARAAEGQWLAAIAAPPHPLPLTLTLTVMTVLVRRSAESTPLSISSLWPRVRYISEVQKGVCRNHPMLRLGMRSRR